MSMVLSAQGAEEASVTPAQEQGSWWFELGMGEALLHSDSGSGSGSTLNLSSAIAMVATWVHARNSLPPSVTTWCSRNTP
jgi:hypothetical protein